MRFGGKWRRSAPVQDSGFYGVEIWTVDSVRSTYVYRVTVMLCIADDASTEYGTETGLSGYSMTTYDAQVQYRD